MKHLIMGTAGHIDHGKTALIKALTNIDCDTHKEEKLRGITINLGFAHLDLTDGNSIGIIDVPGHKDFVNTMVAGASSIDFVMLVIAADSGVMPQTVEHLKIVEMLGIKHGFVTLTKIDLIDEELLNIVEEEVSEFIKGTILEKFPIIKTSAKTKEGIPELKQFLPEIVSKIEERQSGEIFRIFIDRIFTLQGFGTIVTGSVISGHIKKKDTLYLLPCARKLRIRRMERHTKEMEELTAGDRASLNLAGLKKEDFKRGMVVSDRIIQDTIMIDAELTLFQHNRNLGIWTQVIFLLGTYQAQARVHLIDNNHLKGGETAIVQIHLDTPCVALHNDRFVIRSSSSDMTLGGGKVIDAHPLHHRRRNKKLINELHKLTEGGIRELIIAEVRKRFTPISCEHIVDILSIPKEKILEVVSQSLPEDIVVVSSKEKVYLMLKNEKEKLEQKILNNLDTFHKRNSFDEDGKTFEELIGLFGISRDSTIENMMKLILDEMTTSGKLKKIHHTWALKSHKLVLSIEGKKQVIFVEDYIKNSGMKTPLMSELIPKAKVYRIEENNLKQIVKLLVTQSKIYNIDGNFIHSSIVDKCRYVLLKHLTEHKQGIKVSEFRDLVEGNRKICVLMLTQFDSDGITVRKGNYRFITEKGRKKFDVLEI